HRPSVAVTTARRSKIFHGCRKDTIDLNRIQSWVRLFSAYRHAVGERAIQDWLQQFAAEEQGIAGRVLDCVEFFSQNQIDDAFRVVLSHLNGWNSDATKRRGQWRFVAYSSSAGESGDSMLHKFRNANNLAGSRHNHLFIHRSDIMRQRLGREDTVVLIDDFVGTGEQACDSWTKAYFGELLAEVGQVYLVVVAACKQGVQRLAEKTEIEVISHVLLDDAEDVFSDSCAHFTSSEKQTLLSYCTKANPRLPRGRGACGLLIVFAHTCPNNSIPVLHARNRRWKGLFPRYNRQE
ncbi:MAG: phosphoribosyltransferase, partial [Thermoguttaceae bacterium]